ncbi:MAG: hypothetical protein WAM39_14735 [Bryobacteraceae bacterium]
MKLGLWRIRYYYEWLPRDGREIGFALAFRKHQNLLRSWEAPRCMPPAPVKRGDNPISIHALTGEFHAHLTCFCLYSLLQTADVPVAPVVHEDGTLKNNQREQLRRIIPTVRFVSVHEAESLVDCSFPRNRFPALRIMRDRLHLMRKLLDVHAGKTEPTLFVDSDVFFYRNPDYLVEWLRRGREPIYMLDYQNAYGYEPAVLESVYGKPMPPRVNTGLCGFHSPTIDWDKLEFWAGRLLEAAGVNHFSEQALTAMAIGDRKSDTAPSHDYMISPGLAEIRNPSAVMHHFVVPSRTWYYTEAIPAFLKKLDAWK